MTPETLSPSGLSGQRLLIPVGVTLVTLIGLSFAVDVKTLYWIFQHADLGLVGLAALKIPALVLLWSLRWFLVIRVLKRPVPFRFMVHAVLIRSFFNNLTPGISTGGEPFGAYYLSKRTPLSFKEAIASTAAESMAQGLVMVGIILFILIVCVPLLPQSSALIGVLCLGLAGFVGLIGLILYLSLFQFRYGCAMIEAIIRTIVRVMPSLRTRWEIDRLRANLDGFHAAYRVFLKSPTALTAISVLTVIQAVLDILQPAMLFRALHVDIPFEVLVLNATLFRILGIFAIIPGGAGMMEGINVGLYTGLSALPVQVIVAETILVRALDSWLLWIGSGIMTSIAGISLTGRYNPSDRSNHEPDPIQARHLSAH